MPLKITIEPTCYFLPDDGQEAEADLLSHLQGVSEVWLIAYSFTLQPMFNQLLQVAKNGAKLHLYLDHSQAVSIYELKMAQVMAAAGIEVTLGTSDKGPSFICHTKGVTVAGSPPWCWEGSVNFSAVGWRQVNTALSFYSQEWHDRFVQQFEALRKYAWAAEKSFQVMKEPPVGVV